MLQPFTTNTHFSFACWTVDFFVGAVTKRRFAPLGEGGGLHHTMVALKLQQPQYNRKTKFLRCLVFPMLGAK